MEKKNLIASAPSKEKLISLIAEKYWFCSSDDIIYLSDLGHIKKNGRVMFGFSWRKLRGRYRFEDDK